MKNLLLRLTTVLGVTAILSAVLASTASLSRAEIAQRR